MAEHEKFAIVLKCPNCGQVGTRNWEEGKEGARQAGSSRTYVSVSEGFHREEGRTANGEPLIVCDICDEIQPDQLV